MKGDPFEFYIFISKSYLSKLNKKRTFYPFNFEDQYFYQNAHNLAWYSVFEQCGPISSGNWTDSDESYIPYRSICVISRTNLFNALDTILGSNISVD
ncbi:hypothetical protein HZS_409 [Henneguya salminicola]|nr:hypothetical protein HZS_409 [Henneguya salminicola]